MEPTLIQPNQHYYMKKDYSKCEMEQQSAGIRYHGNDVWGYYRLL